MKRIVLIQPPSPYLLEPMWKVPLTLCLIRTYLQDQGHEVRIVDLAEASTEPPWSVPLDADIYGMSVYTPQHDIALRIASYLRKETDVLIIAGGHHVSALKENFLSGSDFDLLIIGEGESALKQLCRGDDPEKIPGIVYQKNGNCFSTPAATRITDLTSLPLPRFDNIDLSKYKGNASSEERSTLHLGVVTSRGCHFKCAFCASRFFWNQRVTWHNAEKIIFHLDYLRTLGVDSIEFMDDNFVVHPDFERILSHLKQLGITWTCMGRSDCLTLEKARLMHASGCSFISLGVESGSDRLLKLMEKKTTVETHKRAISILKKADVPVKALMIAGFPGENEEDARQTEEFIREQPLDLFHFCSFVPFPGTPVWQNPEKYNATLDRTVPYDEYVLVSKDFGPRPILDNHITCSEYLDRYIDAAAGKCTNLKAFERAGEQCRPT